jgi:hypothetical protein
LRSNIDARETPAALNWTPNSRPLEIDQRRERRFRWLVFSIPATKENAA